MSTDPSQIDLTDGQRRYVATRAERLGVSPEQFLLSRVPSADPEGNLETTSNGETALDAAKRLGLVGCITDGPADLATNSEHMEGFGSDGGTVDSC